MTTSLPYNNLKTPLSVFLTTYNNERTLSSCLQSVTWADEIIILDSFSTDKTCEIAQQFGTRFSQHTFMGYGPQKQLALDQTKYPWVLLLDADEMLSEGLQKEIRKILEQGPEADGYELPRAEQVFWRISNLNVRMNYYLRFFNKEKGHISNMPIHAAPKVCGKIKRLKHPFFHFGEIDIHTKVEKINAYSSGLVPDKLAKGIRPNPLIMIIYPPWFFLRSYFFKRGILNGWAGFISSVTGMFYCFLKYAKLYEYSRRGQNDSQMPPKSPPQAKPWHETKRS